MGRDDARESPREYRNRDRDSERRKKPRLDSPEPSRTRETSEERRLRKATRREARAARAQQERTEQADLHFYSTGGANAFNDAQLDQKFVWRKKDERDQKAGITKSDSDERDARHRLEARRDLERIGKRREERAKETQWREREESRAALQTASVQEQQWMAREDEFRLQQSMKRAEIRVRERRAKPIDYLALNLKWSKPPSGDANEPEDEGEGLDVDLEEPYAIFDNIGLEEVDELEQDIKMYLSLETSQANLDFWRSMLLVCSSVLDERRAQRDMDSQQYAERARASAGVKTQIAQLLAGKSHDELTALQSQVQYKLDSREAIDAEYWESLLKELVVYKAKSRLRDMHEVVLANRLEQLRRRQRDEAVRIQRELETAAKKEKAEFDALLEPYLDSMDPPLLTDLSIVDRTVEIVVEADQRRALVAARRVVASTRFVPKKHGQGSDAVAGGPVDEEAETEALVTAEADKAMQPDEAVWADDDIAIGEGDKQSYLWQDKFRPRKPRYFNKVVTGYEWSKYNQTHYDQDNPPPKVVQGYKMTLFLPDLLDKSKTPTFEVIKEPGNEDTCVLVFRCGPPYEDVAFRIVNQDWDFSHRSGFRCTYDRGVLQVRRDRTHPLDAPQLHFYFRSIAFRR